jgi:hypothetical protein
MDITAVSVIASGIVQLLTFYLKSLVDASVKKTGEELGAKVGESIWETSKQAYNSVKAHLSQKPNAIEVLQVTERQSENPKVTEELKTQIIIAMLEDKRFASEMAKLLNKAEESGGDTFFFNKFIGNSGKFAQLRDNYGNINID